MITYLQDLVMESYEANSLLLTHVTEVTRSNVLIRKLARELNELQANAAKSLYITSNDAEFRELLFVLYRASESSFEIFNTVNRIYPLNLEIHMNAIKEIFLELIPHIIEKYGKEEALYIISPRYQQQFAQWG